jgi:thiamine biosynthesis lipoprotein
MTLADKRYPERFKSTISLVFLSLLVISGCWKDQSSEIVTFRGSSMGTTYSVKLFSLPPETDSEKLHQEIKEVLGAIDRLMSTHSSSSELSAFNKYRQTDWFSVSPLTLRVVDKGLEMSRRSEGTFDLTVGKLVDIWGFGKGIRDDKLPSDDSIRRILKEIGYEKIQIDARRLRIRKGDPNIAIDLSAVAKGFAVDEVANRLEENQIVNYLVEVGGEIRVGGSKQNSAPWVIAIEQPIVGKRAIYKTLSIGRNGMATSGDYRNFFTKEGKRYSHVIDPKTGYPITHQTGSVTVIHPSCAMADAWATALLVMGREKGYRMAAKNNLAVLFVYRTENGFQDQGTPEFLTFTEQP